MLIIHGGEDRWIPASSSEELHQSLEDDQWNVKLVLFPDDDHFILLRSAPAVGDEITTCIESL